MELSTRASELREAVEAATDSPAQVTRVGTSVRITAPIKSHTTPAQWGRTLDVVRRGDDWGTTSVSGTVLVWSEIHETEQP
ncbi:hypothetical protein ABUW04_05110 [Streptacidiphilus sp. N1-10]|uniref:Uncharacterized protein n=1 Tax=Streptacidiphilus jeojiensis TaxID=3229225 RepID=A0ABV6XH97_9ACTN